MPRPTMLPTPASSTDLAGKDGQPLSSHELSFALPPPAIASKRKATSLDEVVKTTATSPSYRPDTPISPSLDEPKASSSKRRTPVARVTTVKEEFTLPPPPSRSRKIIQMKPQLHDVPAADAGAAGTKAAAKTSGAAKKKQPSATSAAGRKIARKTAHSLIERRRRSKMNEEFGVLKQMVPACQDQEMHKLAILQASIEYLRYLQQCVADLEANSRGAASSDGHASALAGGRFVESLDLVSPSKSSASITHASSLSSLQSQTVSPALDPQRGSYSSVASSLASPAFGAQPSLTYSPFLSTSPAMPPQVTSRDLDQEATEALLLLNTDRRRSSVRGMSVKDLLTS